MNGLQQVILGTFSSQSEEVRSAASYALGWLMPRHCHVTILCFFVGSVSAGNLQNYLPFILSEIQANPKRQYLLLHSLKEVITCHYGTPEAVAILEPHVALIWYAGGVVWVWFQGGRRCCDGFHVM